MPSRPSTPLADTAAWAAYLAHADIPVTAASAAALEELRAREAAREGSVDANRIGEALGRDPLMTLRVLATMARHRPPRLLADPQTVTAVAVLLGVPPFFRAFGAQPTVEEHLAARPAALDDLRAALARARRAAAFALAVAARRGDGDAALIHQAALLHDFGRLLLWCHAPDLAHEPGAGDAADLAELQWSLAETWALPPLLRRPERARDALLPRARCVDLAVRLARGDASEPLMAQVAELLALPPDDARRFVAEADTAGLDFPPGATA